MLIKALNVASVQSSAGWRQLNTWRDFRRELDSFPRLASPLENVALDMARVRASRGSLETTFVKKVSVRSPQYSIDKR